MKIGAGRKSRSRIQSAVRPQPLVAIASGCAVSGRWLAAWASVLSGVAIAPSVTQANTSVAETIRFSSLVAQPRIQPSASVQAPNDPSPPLVLPPEHTFSQTALGVPREDIHLLHTSENPVTLSPEPGVLWSNSPQFLLENVSGRSSLSLDLATDLGPDVALLPDGSAASTAQAQQPLEPETTPTDPELGTLRLQPSTDPELGVLRLQESAGDVELGNLRLQEQQIPDENRVRDRNEPERSPSVYLLGGVNFFRSDNVFSSEVDPVGDSLFLPSLSIYARPQIGPNTYLIASVGGYLVRYVDFPDADYNELRFRLGLRQILSSRMYGEVNWTNAQLFGRIDGDRFLDDHALRLLLFRSDPIAPDLSIDSFYQFRLSLANPEDRSRISNSLGVALVYDITPKLEAALDYQFTWTSFTEQEREDLYNELIAELSYYLSSTTQINVYGGFSFGESSHSDIDFNSGIFGIGINFSVPLF